MFFDYTYSIVLLGSAVIAASLGTVGILLYLKKEPARNNLEKAVLNGISLAFAIVFLTNNDFSLLTVALVGSLLIFCYQFISRNANPIKNKLLFLFLGFLTILGTVFWLYPKIIFFSDDFLIKKYLFGNATSMLNKDFYFMSFLLLVSLTILISIRDKSSSSKLKRDLKKLFQKQSLSNWLSGWDKHRDGDRKTGDNFNHATSNSSNERSENAF